MALCEPCVAFCEPGGDYGTDEPRVARSEPCVAQVFYSVGGFVPTPLSATSIKNLPFSQRVQVDNLGN